MVKGIVSEWVVTRRNIAVVMVGVDFFLNKQERKEKRKTKKRKHPAKGLLSVGTCLYQVINIVVKEIE